MSKLLILTSVMIFATGCCSKLSDGAVSTRIVTKPPQGPFRLGQTVQFTCEVDSLPTKNLIFRWRSVEHTYDNGLNYSGPSINITFTHSHTLRYVWLFCSIWRSTTQLASSDKIVEIHGLLNTDDSVTRSFSLHQKMLLQLNTLSDSYNGHLAHYVSSLTWYHNGTEIQSNERMNISKNGTSLRFSDMIDSDAGKYEVKISSINYRNNTPSATCNRNVLRMLEQTALHAPVTFYLQQYHIPQYKPEDIIESYFLPMNLQDISRHTITINYTIDIDPRILLGVHPRYWDQWFFRNGVSQSPNTDNVITERSFGNEINISHQLRYNDTDEIAGHYVYIESKVTFFNSMFRHSCRGYHDYIEDNFSFIISVLVHYWSLKSRPILQMERLVLTNQFNRIECTVLNSPFAKLSLWHYRELLLETNKTYLEYQLPPYQFGQFTCQFTGSSKSAIVRENGSLQLLIHSDCCITDEDYYMALINIMNTLCEECKITSENFKNSKLNYHTGEGTTLFSTDIIYSNPEGSITSTTLIHRLQTWIRSQSSPNLTVAGKVLPIDKNCPTRVNAATESSCTSKKMASTKMASTVSPITYGVFFIGLLIGAIGTSAVAIAIAFIVKKNCRSFSGADQNETKVTTEEEIVAMKEVTTTSNNVYERIEVDHDKAQHYNS